jgi:hypothetical protein
VFRNCDLFLGKSPELKPSSRPDKRRFDAPLCAEDLCNWRKGLNLVDVDKKLQECEQYDCEVVQEELADDMIMESE